MWDILSLSIPLKFGYAIGALVIVWWLLRFLDKSNGISFRDQVWSVIRTDPEALSRYFGLRILAVCIVVGLVMSACSPANAAPRFSDKYDRQIQAASSTWLPGQPWKMLKAQYIAESNLNPDAVSPVGASGIAQFMEASWDQVLREMGRNPALVDRRMAGPAIEAGAFYMAKLKRAWISPRPEEDRLKLAQASYNAGMGNILRSQQRCGNPAGYEPIMACLHLVTGHHAAETRTYVPRIWLLWLMLEAG
jgi:hypothetical protein